MTITANVKRIAAAMLAALVVLVGFGGTAMTSEAAATPYGHNGYYCNDKNVGSGKLIIGDSRTCQLWKTKKTGASFVSVWGGHYYGGTNSMSINSNARMKTMKEYVNATVKKKGKCHVYLFSTVNDFNGIDKRTSKADGDNAAKNVISLAKTIKGWNKKADVTIVKLVGSKGKDVSSFNGYLKRNLPGNVDLMGIKADCMAGSNGGYDTDSIHYNSTTLKNIWKKIG